TEQDILPCEVVIYAVGFGTETGENEPYWRNDRLGQTELGFTGAERVRYVVSGTGDGGLVDVFRLTIRDFRYERIFSEIFGPIDDRLMENLRAFRASATEEEGSLYDHFNSLESDESDRMARATSELRNRLRSDTDVILNGEKESLRRILTLNRVSL